MFQSRISAGTTEKLLDTEATEKPDAETISSWSFDMEGHAKKCEATPCMDDHQFKDEENVSVGEVSTVCSQIVLTCLFLARLGRPDILWSVNKLARAVTKWTKSV